MKKKLINFLWVCFGLFISNSINAQYLTQDVYRGEECNVSVFPWTEDFEDNGVNLAACWTQDQISGSTPWMVGYGGANNSNYRVSFSWGTGIKTKLITPAIDLSGISAAVLKFAHRQQASGANQDKLRIYYKTTAEGSWVLLKEYLDNVSDWTEQTIELPNTSSDYYIAFEGELSYGSGIDMDDIVVEPILSQPVISGNSNLAFGAVYNNLVWSCTKEYTIQNKGSEPLIINSAVSDDSEITVAGLPLSINKLETKVITVTLDVPQLATGDYSGSFNLLSNDSETPEFVVNVIATAEPAIISNYIRETFNSKDPDGWKTQAFSRLNDSGPDNSGCIGALLHANQSQGGIETCYVKMGNDPIISFNYRILNYPDWSPTEANAVEYAVFISKDNGETWDQILSVDPGGHVPSTSFVNVEVDASAYANELCLVQIVFHPVPPAQFWVYMDDVKVGTEPAKELQAVSVSGNLIPLPGVSENYTVKVANLGSASPTNYTVKLMSDDGTEIGSLPGVVIAQYETHDFVYQWTPDAAGIIYLYGEVVFAEDENISNNITGKLKVYVQSETVESIIVGTGESSYKAPYNLYYNASLSQTLYHANEIGTNGGEIQSLIYKANILHEGGNLQDVGIQIWIGETDRESLKDGWVTPSSLTEVFNGTLTFPAGQYDLVVPLDVPYQYNGGALVVYSYRKQSGGIGDWNDSFYGTADPNSYRTMLYSAYSGGMDPLTPPAMFYENIHGIPNTTFLIDMQNMGALSGVVSDGVNPLEGVKVQIMGTQLYVFTNAAGEYEFLNLAQGTCTLELSKYGYLDETCNISIVPNAETKRDITLTTMPTFTVKGKVTGPDTSIGVEDVQVTLVGYNNYTTTTDAAGNYSISNVYGDFVYEIQAKIKGYFAYNSTAEVTNSDLTFNIELEEKNYPVVNLMAAQENNNAIVSWDAPIGFEEKSYILDDGSFDTGWRNSNAGLMAWYGTKFEVGESGELTSIDLYGLKPQAGMGEASERKLSIDIFDGDRQLIGSSDLFFLPGDEWINVSVDNIPYTDVFYVMVKWSPSDEGATNYLGYDQDGPHATDGTDWYRDANIGWLSIYELSMGVKGVFMIRANADAEANGSSKTYTNQNASRTRTELEAANLTSINDLEVNELDFIKLPSLVDANAQYSRAITAGVAIPVPIGYNIYRLEENDPKESWVKLSTTTETTYTDADWSALPEGAYQYAVNAIYMNDKLSDARLSNLLLRGLEVNVTINVIANSNDPVNGAVVTLTNQNGNSEQVYSATIDGNATVLFPEVRKGTYDLVVTLAGYEIYDVRNIIVDANLTHNAELVEIIITPFELRIENTENPADRLFSWNNIDPEEKEIAYWTDPENYNMITSLYHNANVGYGVVFDLTNYTDATLLSMDFHHAPWGYSGIWNYKVHVVDIDASQIIYTTETLQTTGDFKWEENISLNNIADFGGKKIGIFMESLSMDHGEFYPVLSADRAPINEHSYQLNLSSLEPSLITQANFGEYLMSLWIMTTEGRAMKISNDTRLLANYTIYLDGEEQATTNNTYYQFVDLTQGEHIAGVKAVYTSGESTVQNISFSVEELNSIDDIVNSGVSAYSHSNNIYIVNENNIPLERIELINMQGQVVYETTATTSAVFNVDVNTGYYIIKMISTEGDVFVTKLYLTISHK